MTLMVVGDRMRKRMELIEISQSELARRTGLTQGTIAGLVTGRSRSSSYLHKIARELRTTPEYLEGEIDDPEADGLPAVELSADERELVERFETMTPADRRALLQVARAMGVAGGARGTLHDSAGED